MVTSIRLRMKSTPNRNQRSQARTISVLALCTALVFGLQVALAAIPNGETVTLLFILYTLYFRSKTLYIIYTFAVLEGLTYGFSVWWIVYLYIWTILWALVMVLGRRERSVWFWSILAACYGLSFGVLCSLPDFVVGGFPLAFTKWVSGIPFDLAHGVFNFAIVFILFKPLNSLFANLQARNMLL